jgi:hypothetical protein
MHQKSLFSVTILALIHTCQAGDLGIPVILSGQVAPGVYGQVQIGKESSRLSYTFSHC